MPNCSVLRCKNRSRIQNVSHGGVSYHRFPRNPIIHEKWIKATGRVDWYPLKNSTICSDHFTEDDFIIKKRRNRYLNETSIPSRNLLKNHTCGCVQIPVQNSSTNSQNKSQLDETHICWQITTGSEQDGWQTKIIGEDKNDEMRTDSGNEQPIWPARSSNSQMNAVLTVTEAKLPRLELDSSEQSNDIKKEPINEFELFGKYVGEQLNILNEKDAVTAQAEIQEVLNRYELQMRKHEVIAEDPLSIGQSEQSQSDEAETLVFICEPDSEFQQ